MHQNVVAGWGIALLSAVVGAWSCVRFLRPAATRPGSARTGAGDGSIGDFDGDDVGNGGADSRADNDNNSGHGGGNSDSSGQGGGDNAGDGTGDSGNADGDGDTGGGDGSSNRDDGNGCSHGSGDGVGSSGGDTGSDGDRERDGDRDTGIGDNSGDGGNGIGGIGIGGDGSSGGDGDTGGGRGGCAGVTRLSYLAHAVMGSGMAALMCPWGDPVPGVAWAVVFGVLSLVLLVARHPGTLHHASSSAVMVYLITSAPAHAPARAPAMPGMVMGGAPEGVAVAVCGCYLWCLVLYLGWRLVHVMGAGDDVRLAYGCDVVLAVGMALMAVPAA